AVVRFVRLRFIRSAWRTRKSQTNKTNYRSLRQKCKKDGVLPAPFNAGQEISRPNKRLNGREEHGEQKSDYSGLCRPSTRQRGFPAVNGLSTSRTTAPTIPDSGEHSGHRHLIGLPSGQRIPSPSVTVP